MTLLYKPKHLIHILLIALLGGLGLSINEKPVLSGRPIAVAMIRQTDHPKIKYIRLTDPSRQTRLSRNVFYGQGNQNPPFGSRTYSDNEFPLTNTQFKEVSRKRHTTLRSANRLYAYQNNINQDT